MGFPEAAHNAIFPHNIIRRAVFLRRWLRPESHLPFLSTVPRPLPFYTVKHSPCGTIPSSPDPRLLIFSNSPPPSPPPPQKKCSSVTTFLPYYRQALGFPGLGPGISDALRKGESNCSSLLDQWRWWGFQSIGAACHALPPLSFFLKGKGISSFLCPCVWLKCSLAPARLEKARVVFAIPQPRCFATTFLYPSFPQPTANSAKPAQ